jgi:hypothetical protein
VELGAPSSRCKSKLRKKKKSMDIGQDRRHEQTHRSKKGGRIKALKGDITQVYTVFRNISLMSLSKYKSHDSIVGIATGYGLDN